MTAKEIAKKYVYGRHNALTDSQEVKDMIADIEEYAMQQVKLLATPAVSKCEGLQGRELLLGLLVEHLGNKRYIAEAVVDDYLQKKPSNSC